MSSFGKWHEEQKSKEAGGTDTSSSSSISSWFPTSETLPLWENAEIPTFSGMRASLESQLPQNVMGMNYQQRFQVSAVELWLGADVLYYRWKVVMEVHGFQYWSACVTCRTNCPYLFFIPDVLCSLVSVRTLLCARFLCGASHGGNTASEVRSLLFLWFPDIHG